MSELNQVVFVTVFSFLNTLTMLLLYSEENKAYGESIPHLFFIYCQKQPKLQVKKYKTSYKSSWLHCAVSLWNTLCFGTVFSTIISLLIVLLLFYHSLIKPNTPLLFIQFNSMAKCNATKFHALEFSVCK